VFRIELTRGSSWQEAAEMIDFRECQTETINAVVAEARHWLMQVQREQRQRGATHYRVVGTSGIVVGGPP
jgi:hypothetical protein